MGSKDSKHMALNKFYVTFQTTLGYVGILASEKGLLGATLPQPSPTDAHRQLGKGVENASFAPDKMSGLMERLKSYFNGEKISFPDMLDLSDATPFRAAVWKQTQLIPYGETRSYQWVAKKVGKPGGARAVGQAVGANPLLIVVPCHRVIASDGGLGGFGGGLEMKKRLLAMEAKHLA